MNEESKSFRLVVVSGGTGEPSSTRMLADRVAGRVSDFERDRGKSVETSVLSLRAMSSEISTALVSQVREPMLTLAEETLTHADGVVASTPIYSAGMSGLFMSFFNVMDNDLLIGKPVVLAATAGTSRHALVVDEQMRSLFAYLRSLVVPTSLFAATEDWADRALNSRIDRAASEMGLLLESDFAQSLRRVSWGRYQHEYGGAAGGGDDEVDFDSDLMRLATGGGGNPHRRSS